MDSKWLKECPDGKGSLSSDFACVLPVLRFAAEAVNVIYNRAGKRLAREKGRVRERKKSQKESQKWERKSEVTPETQSSAQPLPKFHAL